MSGKTYGQLGYEAYADFTGGRTYDDRMMPPWEGLTDKIRGAWEAAAVTVAKQAREDWNAQTTPTKPTLPGPPE